MKFWKISPGRGACYWEDFQNQKLMAINWLDELGDLDKIIEPEKIKQRAIAKGYNTRGRSGIKQTLEFYHDAQIGHIVIAYGKKTIKDIGIIDSSYWHDNTKKNMFHDGYTYVHRKRVNWLDLFKRPEPVSGELLEALQKPTDTIHEIKSNQVKKKIIAKYLVKLVNNPIESGDGLELPLSEEQHNKELEEKEKEASQLSDCELEERAKSADKQPNKITTYIHQYRRNSYVSAYAKRRANGVCDLCGKSAPFHTINGPFLESHHIIGMADGGEDSINNTVALCPNCHRKMHSLNKEGDNELLKRIALIELT